MEYRTKLSIRRGMTDMTDLEKTIAEFFLKNTEVMDFSSKNISKMLFVSNASLSRFAQCCGYKGYREFVFAYSDDLKQENHGNLNGEFSVFTQKVHKDYLDLLTDSFNGIDEAQMSHIAELLNSSRKTFVFGCGSSGFVAKEFQLRFMRIGMDVTAVTDSEMMKMSASLAEESTLVIAISLSGTTSLILDCIRMADAKGAKIVFITSNRHPENAELCDELLNVAYINNLDKGIIISPQISILIVVDILYSYYFSNNTDAKSLQYNETLHAIESNKKK
ncbi:MAG: MurR/RpiR family transcriptional regulator [Clostridiales bacterium]|nr:MurR/RpiR family transcriptional regulator [Clostridiales bacterium]